MISRREALTTVTFPDIGYVPEVLENRSEKPAPSPTTTIVCHRQRSCLLRKWLDRAWLLYLLTRFERSGRVTRLNRDRSIPVSLGVIVTTCAYSRDVPCALATQRPPLHNVAACGSRQALQAVFGINQWIQNSGQSTFDRERKTRR